MRLFRFVIAISMFAIALWTWGLETLNARIMFGGPSMDSVEIASVVYTGIVVDSATNEPVVGAVISDICTWDEQVAVTNRVTDRHGGFKYVVSKAPFRRLEVSCLGYKLYVMALPQDKSEYDLGKIVLTPDIYNLDEVIVSSRRVMYSFSGDTILYFPRSVRTMTGDPVIEVLRQMPGVRVEGKNVYIEDKLVNRTYLNGRLIFGEDAYTPLETIDAKDASLIQAYDEVDEAEELLYGNNAKRRKVLNIVIFEDFKRVLAGEARVEGGVDREKEMDGERRKRYLAFGKIGAYDEKLQTEASTRADNLPSNFGGYQRTWNPRAKVSGVNGPRGKYNVDYNHENARTSTSSFSETTYYPSTHFNSQVGSSTSLSMYELKSSKFELSGRQGIPSAIMDLKIPFQLSERDRSFGSFTKTLRDSHPFSDTDTRSREQMDNFSFRPQLILNARPWNHPVTFRITYNISKAEGSSTRERVSEIAGVREQEFLSISEKDTKRNIETRLSYIIHTLDWGSIILEASVYHNKNTSSLLAVDTITGTRNDALSKDLIHNSKGVNGEVGYRYQMGKQKMEMRVVYGGRYPNHEDKIHRQMIRRTFRTFNFKADYAFQKKPMNELSLSFSYALSDPDLSIFKKWIDDTDPLFITTGNPDLESGGTYSLVLRKSGTFKNGQSFSVDINASISRDLPVNNRVYFASSTLLPEYGNYEIPAGATLMFPVNGGNAYSTIASIQYERQVYIIKSSLRSKIFYTYNNSREGVDNVLFENEKHKGELDLNLRSNFSTQFKVELNTLTGYERFENYLKRVDRSWRETLKVDLRWNFLTRGYLTSSYKVDYRYNSTSRLSATNHELNVAVGCRLFKNHKGLLAFNGYDILNRKSNLTTYVTDQYVRNSWRSLVSSFFSLSFEYRFNNLK